ncbi:MAG: protein kinase [Candidatus Peribacteraceae bacterium]|jgi:serine/threonine protein kinase
MAKPKLPKTDLTEKELQNRYGFVDFDHNPINGKNAPNSAVYKFKIKGTNDTKVIKVLSENFREGNKEAFIREKEAMQACSHDQIITFEGDGMIGKNYYFIFPFIEGRTLDDQIKSASYSFTEDDVLKFISNAISVITNLYESGIIHRDVKPANIIYRNPDDFLLLDLGISLFVIDNPSLKRGKGPLHYLSPEQVKLCLENRFHNQHKVSFASDYYSLGLIGLEMITGKKIADIVDPDKSYELSSLIEENADISPKIKNLLVALLQQSPIARVKRLDEIGGLHLPVNKIKAINPDLWIQLRGDDHKSFLINEYFTEYEPENMGIVLSGDQIRNHENVITELNPLIEKGLKIVIDPRTMRLYEKNISYLKEREYNNFMDDPELSKAVYDFENEFDPYFYIAPYFKVEDDKCHALQRCLRCYKEIIKLGVSEEDLYFGIALEESLVSNHSQLQDLIDLIAMCEEFKNIYVVFGSKKSAITGPCKDKKWLLGVKHFIEQVGLTKNIFWSLSDLSAFYYIGSHLGNFSIAPSRAGRKVDFEQFNESGGGNSKSKKNRCYCPQLLNDIYTDLELFRSSASGIPAKQELHYDGIFYKKGVQNEQVSKSHFVEVMKKEKNALVKGKSEAVKPTFVDRLKSAEQLYTELEKKYGFQFHESNNASFIDPWLSVFGD